jgi:hypothetical protein
LLTGSFAFVLAGLIDLVAAIGALARHRLRGLG